MDDEGTPLLHTAHRMSWIHKLLLNTPRFGMELYGAFYHIYFFPVAQTLGSALHVASLYTLVTGPASTLLLPYLGHFADRGPNPHLRKTVALIASSGVVVSGLVCVVTASVLHIVNEQEREHNITAFTSIAAAFYDGKKNGTAEDVQGYTATAWSSAHRQAVGDFISGLRNDSDAGWITNSSSTVDKPALSTDQMPFKAWLGLLGFVLLDIGYDCSLSFLQTLVISCSPPEEQQSVLAMGVIMGSFGGMLMATLGIVDFTSILPFADDFKGGEVAVQTSVLGAAMIVTIVLGLSSTLFTSHHRYHKMNKTNKRPPQRPTTHGHYRLGNSDGEETDSCQNDAQSTITATTILEGSLPSEDVQDYSPLLQQQKTQRFRDNGGLKGHEDKGDHRPDAVGPHERSLPLERAHHFREEVGPSGGPLSTLLGFKIQLGLVFVSTALISCLVGSYDSVFSDFVGKNIYGGHPNAAPGSERLQRYEEGLRMAARGKVTYYATYLVFSFVQPCLLNRIGARIELVSIQLLMAVAVTVLILTTSLPAFFLSTLTCGMDRACLLSVPYIVANKIVQTMAQKAGDGKNYVGITMSLLAVSNAVGFAVGLPIVGFVADVTGDLSMTLWLPAGLACLTAVLFLGVGKM